MTILKLLISKNIILFPFLKKCCQYAISLMPPLEERRGEEDSEYLLIILEIKNSRYLSIQFYTFHSTAIKV